MGAASSGARGPGGPAASGTGADPDPAAPTAPVHGGGSRRPGRPVSPRPRADCTADRAGGLTFDVRLADQRAEEVRDAALLLRRRGGDDEHGDTVRLPLTPVAAEGPLRAALPSTMSLPEGRWDASLLLGDAEPRRLLPGVHDLRSLVDRTPRSGRTWLGVRIPYATKYGNLTVRSWLRWPHAEAGELRVEDDGMELSGRLYGARLSPTARLEAHPRHAKAAADGDVVAVPLASAQEHGQEHGQGHEDADGAAFTAALPYAPLTRHPVWDLWLRPSAEACAVRIARILDDVPDKKRIFTYPPRDVTVTEGADGTDGAGEPRTYALRPYYTLDNDLAVRAVASVAVPEEGEEAV
ncbi:hypothetical protein ACWGJ2_38975 [Streptomyces sp. NPDC054796]